ncbi:hypothetical protein FRB99_000906 [Tulasnella sp. 403]|nr:hypothetical protein FRB99_000906 [Tulasnella sp. 403]
MLACLLDCVQESMTSAAPVDKARIVRLALWNLVAAHSEKLLNVFLHMYLKSQLLLDIPTLSDTKIAPLLMEAGAFAGFEVSNTSQGCFVKSPSSQVMSLTELMTTLVSISSRSTIMLTAVMGTTRGSISFSSFMFMFLSFLPSLLGLFTVMAFHFPLFWGPVMSKREIHEMGRNGQYKQEILLFGLADWVMGKWREVHELEKTQEEAHRESGFTLGVSFARDSVETLCYALIALGMFPPSVSIGNMRLCQSCADSLVNTIQSLNYQIENLVRFIFHGTAFLESQRLEETLLRPKEEMVDYVSVVHPNGRRGMSIEARDLSFTYPGQNVPTLKNINISIEPGETLAVVGFNGGGKTTLVKVLMGLYDHEGTLLINGRPAVSYTRSSLHAHTTVCFQDYAKYNLSIKENVGTGNYPRMDDAELMREALKKGGADEIVSKFPKGVEERLSKSWVPAGGEELALLSQAQGAPPPPPPLGLAGLLPPPGVPGPPPPGPPSGPPPESLKMTSPFRMSLKGMSKQKKRLLKMGMRDAKGLSGGQWQRIALARAFMRSEEADLVVFDEPSASLDARAEHELFERIHSLSLSESGEKIRTTIYVSHRFSTTRRADKIAVVEDGTIAELGSHDELMKLNGRYAELFNLQAKAFVD